MPPVLKRILLHGGATAVILAGVGFLFAEMAGMWTARGAERPGSADGSVPVSATLRYRVPLMMAFWGFAFVAVSEFVLHRLRRHAPAKPPEPPPDDAERLLNELLAQAEAKMAAEAESQKTEDKGQKAENPEVKPEGSGQKPEAEHRSDGGEDARSGPSVL
jgi:hypothetical protein